MQAIDSYFTEMGFPCPEGFNLADWLLDVTTCSNPSKKQRRTQQKDLKEVVGVTRSVTRDELLGMNTHFLNSSTHKGLLERLVSQEYTSIGEILSQDTVKYGYLQAAYASSWSDQFVVLWRRNYTNTVREWRTLMLNMGIAGATSLMLGTLFSETDNGCDSGGRTIPPPVLGQLPDEVLDQLEQIQDAEFCFSQQLNLNAIVYVIPTLLMMMSFQMTATYIESMKIYIRETSSGTYRPGAYLLAKICVEVPRSCVQAFIYGSIIYKLVGLRDDLGAFMFFVLTLMLTLNISDSFCGFFGTVCPNMTAALNCGNAVYGLGILFAGFYATYEEMPIYYKPLYFLSVFKWPCSALLFNEFDTGVAGSDVSPILEFNGLPAFEAETKWIDLSMCFGFIVFWHTCSFIALTLRASTGKVIPKAGGLPSDVIPLEIGLPPPELAEDMDSSQRENLLMRLPSNQKIMSSGSRGNPAQVVERQNSSGMARRKTSYSDTLIAMRVRWNTLGYQVKSASDGKQLNLLNGVTGCCTSGQLMAVMGPSDAGKSTLLDILAGRKSQGTISGQVLYNGETQAQLGVIFPRIVGYVVQDTYLLHTLTVRETLMYSAQLRLPSSLKPHVREEVVDDVIEQLGLLKVAHSKVGDDMNRGVSGGEFRRLGIATELVTSPSLLILDEPTSGLSAADAFTCIRVLRKLATNGHTVIFSIHQPRSNIFSLFDTLLLMRNGEVCYAGATSAAPSFFASLGYPTLPGHSYADHFMDVITLDEKTVEGLKVSYTQSDVYRKLEDDVNNGQDPRSVTQEIKMNLSLSFLKKRYARSFGERTRILTHRNVIHSIREPSLFLSFILQNTAFGVIMGSLWAGLDMNTLNGRLQSSFALTFLSIFVGQSTFAAVPQYIMCRTQLNRERASGTYDTLSFFLSKMLVETPIFLLVAWIFGPIVYFWIGFNSDNDAFLFFLLNLGLFVNGCVSIIGLISAVSPNFDIAFALMQFVNAFYTLTCGFYVTFENIPAYYKWLNWGCLYRYGIFAFFFNEYGMPGDNIADDLSDCTGLEFDCTMQDVISGNCPLASEFPCTQAELAANTCDLSGTVFEGCKSQIIDAFVMRYYDMPTYDIESKWLDMGIMIAMTIGFRYATYLALKHLHKEVR
jgi:ATP-binding cassette subfamily G (WHITE) protein 2